jgi:divalent metal cation (Fe/Co/Zn/Cd) transporter
VAEARSDHVRRGLLLEYFTIGYNSLEALVALVLGALAGSIALVGFGLDSVIEVTSGAALVWRLRSDHPATRERNERLALKIVGACFLLLAAYVAWEAAESLWIGQAPRRTVPGIVLACASLIVMPLLARAKRKVAESITSSALHADSKQTDLCAYLSAILLFGLVLNATLGWWWADPVAAIIMVPIIANEGRNALRGKQCCDGCHAPDVI